MNLFDIKENLKFDDKFSNLSRRLKKNSLISYWYDCFAEDLYFENLNDTNISGLFDDDNNEYIHHLPEEVLVSDFFRNDFWNRRKDDLHERAKRIALCSKFWSGDYYCFQGVKDLKKVNLCRDRFCDNCQNTLAVQRSDKYEGVLMKIAEDHDVFHVVLTVPNVSLNDLSRCLDKMFSCYQRLCQFLDGRKKVHNVDFSKLGYLGSVRALEITKNSETGRFHPHFHCIFVCKKGTKIQNFRTNVNLYSFKKYNSHIRRGSVASNEPQRYFSDFEILLQKVWRLLYDGYEINYSNIDELKIGYSCMIENARGRYKEVFKYATKGLLSADPNKSPVAQYADFVLLFVALYRRRLLQGYGCLYRMKFENKIDLSDNGDDIYLEVVKELHKLENPIAFYDDLQYISDNIGNKNITYISRKSVASLGANDET